jgi:hypothetical protein
MYALFNKIFLYFLIWLSSIPILQFCFPSNVKYLHYASTASEFILQTDCAN